MRSSMLNDLVAGNRLEAPWLSGAVVRMAAEAGIAAPVNATMYAAVSPYINGTQQ
jgi:2-dehydropantoate 2-reductase